MFVLDKRNTAWLSDSVSQTSLGMSATSANMHITTQYSYDVMTSFDMSLIQTIFILELLNLLKSSDAYMRQ